MPASSQAGHSATSNPWEARSARCGSTPGPDRVYFAMQGNVLMLLLAGGDKNTQQTDIIQAHDILNDYKEQRQ